MPTSPSSRPTPGAVDGRIETVDGLDWYVIDGVDLLDPFLVTITSPDDHWAFVSTSGALTAGRRHAGQALFPYETDDRLHRSGGRVGPITLVRAGDAVWQPFAPHTPIGTVRRTVAKTLAGDRLRFEERHPELGLTFRATLAAAGPHGWSRTCALALDADAEATEVEVLDGLLDVLPAGVDLSVQQTRSTLVDAYRRSEVVPGSGAAVFALEAAMTDDADPAEMLRATLVWSRGLDGPLALSERQVRAFRSGRAVVGEHLTTGAKGSFLASATVSLGPGEQRGWTLVADVHLDHAEVARRLDWLAATADPRGEVAAAVERSHAALVELLAAQDGLQRTGDRASDGHHLANVLFNAMRGGALLDDHRVVVEDVVDAIRVRNAPAAQRARTLFGDLAAVVEITELREAVGDDAEVGRLVDEFLPLVFSRRHGDPSRPWNQFHIAVTDDDGEPITAYQGNWRDIFQNWEAMLQSFPAYLPSVVAKFLNASTRDGHNPYRIDHEGIDWEVPGDDVWDHFGYWGDHQLVYLQRLLVSLEHHQPGALAAGLDAVRHSHADVPYRLHAHAEIVADPKHTLTFDAAAHAAAQERVATLGTDGRLVPGEDGRVHHASLAEKLLIPALAKVSSLVPGGGVWMNTQRPEWNDANNALVGNGLSVVTAFHLEDYLRFVAGLLVETDLEVVPLDPAVDDWLRALAAACQDHAELHDPSAITPSSRRALLDRLGLAWEAYRDVVHASPPAASPRGVPVAEVLAAVRSIQPHVDAVTAGAVGEDGLVASYRLLVLGDGTADVQPLYVMLEGQVASLNQSGTDPAEVVAHVDALAASPLHRADHDAYMLYPARRLPAFVDRNRVPADAAAGALDGLVDAGLLTRDTAGALRFAGDLRNAGDLAAALDATGVGPQVRGAALDAWEATFAHHAFTGRSQTMHRYEGLGSIYWHMVVKLLLAVQERLHDAVADGADEATVDALVARYRQVRAGLGYRRTAAQFGAFPLDPHSHSPLGAGAQQPGMTGATKEGILVRLGELGVQVREGRLAFRPVLLTAADLLDAAAPWAPLGPDAQLEAGQLGFTHCGVPVVYREADEDPWTRVTLATGDVLTSGPRLDAVASRAVLARRAEAVRVDVGIRLRH